MSFISFENRKDANGYFNQVRKPDGRSALLFIANGLLQSPVFGENIAALNAGTAFYVADARKRITNLSEIGWKDQAPALAKVIANNFVSTHRLAIGRIEKLDAQHKEWLTANPIDPARASEVRTSLKGRRVPDILDMAFKNPLIAAAIIEFPLTSGLSADLVEQLKGPLIEQNLALRYASQQSVKPSLENLFAQGPDLAVGRARAREAMAAHRRSRDEITDVEALLKNTVEFVALASDASHQATFEMLMAA